MFIDKSMTKKLITITADTDIFEARRLLTENRIRHLPVVNKDAVLVGIVTDRDVRSAMPSSFASECDLPTETEKIKTIKVRDIMTQDPVTVNPTHTLQDAILLLEQYKVGALPVVDENRKVIGILSVRDLLRAFINVLGIGQPGVLLGIVAEDKLGQTKKIVDAISEENIPFGSILVARHWEEGKRAVFPYLLTNTVGPLKKKLVHLGYEIIDPLEWTLESGKRNV